MRTRPATIATIAIAVGLGWAMQGSLIALVLSCVGEFRRGDGPVTTAFDAPVRAGGEPIAAGRAVAVTQPIGAGPAA